MSMRRRPRAPVARMSQGRLIVTIAAGVVLAVVALALLPFLFIGGVAVLGVVAHLIVLLLPLIVLAAGIAGVVRWQRRRR